ncbi:MmgE/PrpD family protein [Pelagibacterium luteolum]|uniref:2-methylcitrate dehydratase PrpD n=1 Tax=Pelagibacterium luteolum TaxID=440168 RepID=A0A1G7ZYT5_9HYPH|nr:MmgE/PrpD family protein [Pelagibacterium luteolum]SDH13767.1 2-methylcitrate dehydratase PrpD [Pelagibacterium luteolum]
MTDSLSNQLAQWVLTYDENHLSDEVIAKALDCVLDSVASALAGQSALSAAAARGKTGVLFGHGKSKIWFSDKSSTLAGAAFCNAMAASSLDLDDGHRSARGHPGSAIIPAVLAVAEGRGLTDRQVLAAIAIGYEISVRIARAQNPAMIKTHQSGRWAGFGVVAACGRLQQLTLNQLANAFAIAGVWAPNQLANGSSGYANETGNWAKEGIPISVFQAVTAIHLARDGFTGPTDLFDFETHYTSAELSSVPDAPNGILATYFKRYACCRYIHPALDAWQRQFGSRSIDVAQIVTIEVQTFAWALKLSNKVRPDSLVDIQFSLPYCLAMLILFGPQALLELKTDMLFNDQVSALAGKINLTVRPELDRQFPAKTLAQLSVRTRSGDRLASPPSVPPIVLERGELEEKFYAIAKGKISHKRVQALICALTAERTSLSVLYKYL